METPQQGRANLLKVGESSLRVDTENGRKYITLNGDPNDPSTVFTNVPRRFIRQVTFMDNFYKGFRTDGLYRHKGATARVETRESGGNMGAVQHQNISISAGSIRTLREIYSKVRAGELLKPNIDWAISETDLTQREAEKIATEATTKH
jgi:hypothetical protein